MCCMRANIDCFYKDYLHVKEKNTADCFTQARALVNVKFLDFLRRSKNWKYSGCSSKNWCVL